MEQPRRASSLKNISNFLNSSNARISEGIQTTKSPSQKLSTHSAFPKLQNEAKTISQPHWINDKKYLQSS